MRLAVIALVVSAQLVLGACGADKAEGEVSATSQGGSESPEPTASASDVGAEPEETETPIEPPFRQVDAELLCLTFQALQEMTSVGGLSASEMMSIPEFASQVRGLSNYGTKFPIPEVNAAAAVTVASVQSTGTMDVEASRVLGEFCADYPLK